MELLSHVYSTKCVVLGHLIIIVTLWRKKLLILLIEYSMIFLYRYYNFTVGLSFLKLYATWLGFTQRYRGRCHIDHDIKRLLRYHQTLTCRDWAISSQSVNSIVDDMEEVRWPSGLIVGLATGWSWVRITLLQLRFATLVIPFTQLYQCISEETLKAAGPFYLVAMPGEV